MDEDYMSESLLKQCEDVRPGLVLSKTVKRKYEIERKHTDANKKSYRKPLKQLEEEKRTEGLNSALKSDNKGFAMLQKMGYVPGMAIGKPRQSSVGIREPIKVEVKSDRGGLGRESEIKEKTERFKKRLAAEQLRKKKKVAEIQESYQQSIRRKRTMKFLQQDLWSSQKICEQFDKEQELEAPSEPWFWTPQKSNDEEDDEDDKELDDEDEEDEEETEEESLDSSDQLLILTAYLRKEYLYCIWCGTKFDDEEDMKSNCPGTTREDHD